MALSVTLTGTTVTLDETAGLQNDDTNTTLPSAFSSRLTALGAPAAEINHAVSSGDVITISGVTGAIGNLAFTDSTGGALDGDTSGLFTNDGEEVFLWADPTNDNIVVGKTEAGAIVFAVYLEQTATGAKIWSVQYEALEHLDGTNPDDSLDLGSHLKVAVSEQINFGFAGAPSGSNLFMTFGDPNSTQIVVIGKNPLNQSEGGNITTKDVLNISQAGSTTSFGVNGNQINAGEGAYITYVTGTNTNFLVPNLDQNEADVEANIAFQNVFNATGGSFTVNQTNPGIGPVTVKITAFSTAAEPGVNFVDGLSNDTQIAITSASFINVVKKSGNTQYTPVATVNADGTLTVTGLSSGDTVQWTTSATHNRVLIENISNADTDQDNDNNTFDIGGFSLVSSNAASAVVGTAIHFEDDGPTAAIVQGTAKVAHDETAGIDADANDTTAAAVAALFAGLTNVSSDLSPTGYAQNSTAVVSATGSSYGTDSFGGTTAFSLAVSAAGVDSGLDTTNGTSIFLFKEGDLVVGRIGSAAGAAAFAVAINGTSGVVSVAQYASLKHPGTTNPDDSVSITDGALLAVVTVTDGDGDKATSSTGIGDAVQFQDDGPTAGIAQGTATVAHDETAGVDADADDTTAAGVVALFAGVANKSTDLSPGYAQEATPIVTATGSSAGADNEGATTAFSLAVSSAGVDSGLDTTGGTSIFLFKEGDLVVGRIGSQSGQAAFAVAINSSTGVVSVAQFASLKHPTGGASYDEAINITDGALLAVVTVTDGDGDTATSSTGIGDAVQFQDDGPSIGPIADGQVDFAAGASVTKTLSALVGVDDPATYSITSSPASLTILDGTVSQTTLLRDLSSNNTVATYYKDVDGSGTHNAGDIDFFKLTVSGGNYTFDVLQNPPPAEISFSFAGAPSGSNLFMTFGDPTSSQIVVIGENPLNQSQGGNITTKDVLNISQAGSTTSFGVNGNQLNDNANYPTEGAYITYVTGTNTNFLVPNLDQNEADVEANINFQALFNATSASFTVNQTNPGVGPITVKITAYSTTYEPGTGFVDGLTNDTHVDITSATLTNFVVKSGNTTYTPVATVDDDGNLIITGLSTGDKVQWTTDGTHNRVLIENISAHDGIDGNDNNTFDIGGFSLIQSQPAPDEKLDFTVQIADADGDTASSSFSVKIDGNHDNVINV
ncbi:MULTISPECIES: DUF5801 repeats-in-toxin domain-containing protein [unclassified Bradyrhizobium]|uniref:DUF5801 repeats-in-toxin domain-containing protein n=2 Tax=Nitrobacteraceae TaxID=41294 RepID=UPI0015866957|nr:MULTISPECIES: DUF5801 repeats-in-toxin domain-containing protein [unclassified Bradyrhizobium]MDD1518555.1 hypothetical protein [Bradyrhizobium sp. WBAH30]MDD1542353.1 hypothetical protein [Bradyrhizobium sp. WBAH41]MDD1589324.1 hypothetical protein [Bradyrhizobium sp. WBAH42]QCJ92626.1 hypothetical protein DAA57_32160 [Bradyrhizobium yuanmingense]MDD1556505.1 hypothetical protein [Bradyrhizobium sp. WBAH23]